MPAAEIGGDDSKLIMDQALPFITQAAASRTPFLAVIWFHAPHKPVVSAAPYTDGYSNNKDYYGCLTALDQQLGRLRQTLSQLGVSDGTMLWYCSDNGPEGSDSAPGRTKGLRGRKRSLYEGGVRVPGLLVWPELIKEGRIVSLPCSTSDYLPTVLDALGYQLPVAERRPYDGVSLLPVIRENLMHRPQPLGFESRDQVALTDNQYKIYSKDQGKTYELYDLIADPSESKNLAAHHPDVLHHMRRTIDQWRQSCRNSANGSDY